MFGDLIRIATRTGAVLVIVATLLAPFLIITIPSVDYTVFSDIIGKGYALMNHWIPGFSALWTFATATLTAWLLIKGAQLAIWGSRLVLTIFK